MAMMAYGYFVGQKSGQIKGSISQKGREDSIGVIAFSHAIVSPRDPQSGLPTGVRMHKPFVLTKELDKSTPILYNVLCTNENLSSVTIKFWTPQLNAVTGVGKEVQHYTIKLTNANISQMDLHVLSVVKIETAKFPEFEEISLTYQAIEWTWNDGGMTASDDWEARV
jgi:type VI secretion system secreted protein Hcp